MNPNKAAVKNLDEVRSSYDVLADRSPHTVGRIERKQVRVRSGKARLDGSCCGDNPRAREAAGLDITPVGQIDEIAAADESDRRDAHLYVDDAAIDHAHREFRVVHRGLLRLEARKNVEVEMGVRVDQSGQNGKAR